MLRISELFAVAIIYIILHIIISKLIATVREQGRRLPLGPTGWPVIGALSLLGSMPHVALAKMAKKYGPIMYLKVGTCGMVVASTPNAAKAFLKTLDINFSNRPPNAGKNISSNLLMLKNYSIL
ncbi:hypothetical protein MTR67_022201 [Solanum verrucosum]|uniref:Uncharacterized protein n=1 Tax=Solanum verrucosum TaxID=315347 RepID=A0AAF0QSZ2_SOLVR|nr:hypothetical protein MTR67_022201 [Solanum verrucosum]